MFLCFINNAPPPLILILTNIYFTYKIDEGVVHADFTRKVVLSRHKGKKAHEKHMNYLDSKRFNKNLIQKIENEKRPVLCLLLLAFSSGMRFSELISLNRNDFDFALGISKARGYSSNTGEGVQETKTMSSERVIKIDKRAMNIFEIPLRTMYSILSFLILPQNIKFGAIPVSTKPLEKSWKS